VLVDPPYDLPEDDLAGVLTGVAPALAAPAVVVVERGARTPEPAWPSTLVRFDRRTYGDTVMWFAELADA
jgi:16S rRNA (guanine966-N2)-methyltransferase